MRILRSLATALVITAFVVGCQEPTLPIESGPSFNFLNGPGNPGSSGVFRFQGVFVIFSTDPDRDLLAAHFQADDIFFCGGDSDFPLADTQFVNNQEDVLRALTQLQDAPIFIYRLSDPEPDGCKLLAENWLYQGTHSLSVVDNDVALGGPGANSFGWNGRGTVYDPGGNRFQYTEHQNALVAPDGTFLGFINEDIRISGRGN